MCNGVLKDGKIKVDLVIAVVPIIGTILYTTAKLSALFTSSFTELKLQAEESAKNHEIHFKNNKATNLEIEQIKKEIVITKYKLDEMEKKLKNIEKGA